MTNEDKRCPIPATHQKWSEAEYFLSRMLSHYHQPLEFQFNLNAFIQALRNITFMLQSEETKPEGFDAWYEEKRNEMRNHKLLPRFVAARNIVVKQSMLAAKSKAWSGLYRGRRLKLAIQQDIPPFSDTPKALEGAKAFAIGFILDEGHAAIGEQVGVERTWIVEELGDEEVVTNCLTALNYMGELIAEAHALAGMPYEYEAIEIDMGRVQVLLESDVDPTLPEKWGW